MSRLLCRFSFQCTTGLWAIWLIVFCPLEVDSSWVGSMDFMDWMFMFGVFEYPTSCGDHFRFFNF